MRIGTRLGLGFVIVLVLCMLATSSALYNAGANAKATQELMHIPLAKERLFSDWLNTTNTAIARTSMIARTNDPTLATSFAGTMNDSVTRTTEMLKQIELLLRTPAEKEMFQRVIVLRRAYQDAKMAVMDARKIGDSTAAEQAYTGRFEPAAQVYGDTVRHLLKMQRDTIDAIGTAIEVAHEQNTRLAIILSALATALGLVCAWFITRSITVPLHAAVVIAETVAAGDLSTVFDEYPGDEVGKLMRSLQGMNGSLSDMVLEVQQSTKTISTASYEIAAGNLDLSSRTEQQASSLEETAASMEELASTVRQNADNASHANDLARVASEVAVRGNAIVGQVVDTMSSIDESARKIVDIISVIDGIAFQTNILALNAAVEAARAGEQGRGFAVVASEVRNLAHRSANAAKEIKTLIENSMIQVNVGSALVEQAGVTMSEVVSSVAQVTNMMAKITDATQEQSLGIERVNEAIGQMDQVTQQNAALVEQATAAAASMQDQTLRLTHAAAGFRLATLEMPIRPQRAACNLGFERQ